MGAVKRLAEEVKRGLEESHPKLRKTVVRKDSWFWCMRRARLTQYTP